MSEAAAKRANTVACGERRRETVDGQDLLNARPTVRCALCDDGAPHCRYCKRCSYWVDERGRCKKCQPLAF